MSNRKDCGMSSKSVGIYLGEIYNEMSSRREYMGYLRAKFERLKDGSNPIGIRIGQMDGTDDFALLLHQGAYNQSLLITIQVSEGRITHMRMSEYEV